MAIIPPDDGKSEWQELDPEEAEFIRGLCGETEEVEYSTPTPAEMIPGAIAGGYWSDVAPGELPAFDFSQARVVETHSYKRGCRHPICSKDCDQCIWETPVACPQCGAPVHLN